MKRSLLLLSLLLLSVSFVFAQDTGNKQISKKDWEEYQQYKKEQADKVQVSDEEYEQYQQYLKEKEQNEINNQNQIKDEEKIEDEESLSKNDKKENTEKKEKISENEVVIMFGKLLNNSTKVTAKNSYYGSSATTSDTDSEGWRIKIDGFKYIAENTGLGVGVSYFSNFKSDETRILNLDVLLKQRFPLKNREKTYLYLIGGLGYGHFTGITRTNYYDEYNSYLYYIELNDGFHWMLSFGIDFTPFIIDLSYSCNYSKISTDLAYITADASYCSFALSIGYKFTL